MIFIIFEISVFKGIIRIGYIFIEFIVKFFRNMKIWYRTRLVWYRGLIYGFLFVLIRFRFKLKFLVNMFLGIRIDI